MIPACALLTLTAFMCLICQGIAARSAQGTASSEKAAAMAAFVPLIADLALKATAEPKL